MNIRDLLNKLKWKDGFCFDKVEIWYIDRGAPGGTNVILGEDVEKIGKSFIYTRDKAIPFHRIVRIIYEERILFDRFKRVQDS